MIFQPAALALLLAATLNALMLAAAGVFALQLLRQWNPHAASETQIALERRTYLVSTLVGLSLLLGLPMLALFVHTADAMAPFFTGAMCAVGSLKANAWGMPALYALLAGFFVAAAWRVLNRLDLLGWDTPLIRSKYKLLLLLAPLAVAQAVLLWRYFLELDPAVITSCCGSLFGPAASGVAADFASLPVAWAQTGYVVILAASLAAGSFAAAGRRWAGAWFGLTSTAHFLAALVAVVAFIAPYVYEEPNHHCPFCLLQAEHGYAGWVLYPPLFFGTAAGIGAGLASRIRAASLAQAAPATMARLARWALAGQAGFALAAGFYIWHSTLVL